MISYSIKDLLDSIEYNSDAFVTQNIDYQVNSHEREVKVVYAKDLITSLAIGQMSRILNKVIEKNPFYLCIHIVPKGAFNDACDIDY